MTSELEVASKPFTWSYSALKSFNICPKRYYHYSVAKDITEPVSEHLRVGWDTHKAFELRVKEGRKLPLPLAVHEPFMTLLANAQGAVSTELRLGLTRGFTPTAFFAPDVWYRAVIDYAAVFPGKRRAAIVDYKTGKPSDDLTQLRLGAVALLAHDPDIDRVTAAMFFIGFGTTRMVRLSRDDVTGVWADVLPGVNRLERAHAEDRFEPRPGGLCKRWCSVKSCIYNGG
jgi:hypothetical protein